MKYVKRRWRSAEDVKLVNVINNFHDVYYITKVYYMQSYYIPLVFDEPMVIRLTRPNYLSSKIG